MLKLIQRAGLLAALLVVASPVLAITAVSFTETDMTAERPFWKQRGCPHGHPSQAARNDIRELLLNHRAYPNWGRARHLAVCVDTRRKARVGLRVMREARAWRLQYAHVWPIRLARRDPGWRAWARGTAQCESTMNQGAVSGNGLYYSYFQWAVGVGDSPNTWGAAGGYGDPRKTSYSHQAVLAIDFASTYGKQHWPVCGR